MSEWPTDFDFATDEICQTIFKPYIEYQLERLGAYDAFRPHGHVYEFHLHSKRVAQNVQNTILYMGLPDNVAENMYWAVLPHDIGKMVLPIEIWDTEDKPDDALKTYRRTHTSTGAEIINESSLPDHPFKDLMLDIMMNHHEKVDGTGHHGVPGDQLSAPVRLTCIADSFDGWRVVRPHYGDRDTSVPGVLKRIREEKGPAFFDMEMVEVFEKMKMAEYNNAS